MQTAAALASQHSKQPVLTPGVGAAGFGLFWGEHGRCRSFLATAALVIFAMSFGGCGGNESSAVAAAERAYAVYDSRVDREIVAGHDDTRGNYVEVRISPKKRAEVGNLKPEWRGSVAGDGDATIPLKSHTQVSALDGKAVLR